MYKGLSVSVVIPCFNEEHGIAAVLKAMPDYVDQVVVVDNNSTDETGRIAQELGAEVVFETNKGYGNAYKAGFPRARGDIVATADGDGTYPTYSIGPIIDYLLENRLDFVSASRFPLRNPKAMRFRNVLGNMILTYTTRLLWMRWIADSQSGMWVFRRDLLNHIHLESQGMPFSEEIKLDVIDHPRLRFGEYHIDYSERIGETKLFAWKDGVENELFLFRLRLRRFLNPQSKLTQRSVQYQPRLSSNSGSTQSNISRKSVQYQPEISPKSVRTIPEPPLQSRKD